MPFRGGIQALENAGADVVCGFAPLMLAERGWRAAAAGSTTRLAPWLVAVSLPLGGLISSRLGPDRGLAAGLVAFAALWRRAPGSAHMVPLFIAFGVVGGVVAGPFMSLPDDVLSPDKSGTRDGRASYALLRSRMVAVCRPLFRLSRVFAQRGADGDRCQISAVDRTPRHRCRGMNRRALASGAGALTASPRCALCWRACDAGRTLAQACAAVAGATEGKTECRR